MVLADCLGLLSGVLIVAVTTVWFSMVYKVQVPRQRNPYFAVMLLAAGLGIAAFIEGCSWIGGIPAGLAITLGLMLPGLSLQSSQAKKVPSVAVGDAILNFSAPNHLGETFDLASMSGQPFLLKFFRGHW